MRSFIALVLMLAGVAVVLPPSSASAEPPIKPVEVVNFPAPQSVAGAVEVTNLPEVQDVFVTNKATGCSSQRFQLLGFTVATFGPNFFASAGPYSFTRACQMEFPASRVCTLREALETTTIPENLTGVAFIAFGETGDFRNINNWFPCIEGAGGMTIDGAGRIGGMACTEALPFACCALID